MPRSAMLAWSTLDTACQAFQKTRKRCGELMPSFFILSQSLALIYLDVKVDLKNI